jgi:hypothetical protein
MVFDFKKEYKEFYMPKNMMTSTGKLQISFAQVNISKTTSK